MQFLVMIVASRKISFEVTKRSITKMDWSFYRYNSILAVHAFNSNWINFAFLTGFQSDACTDLSLLQLLFSFNNYLVFQYSVWTLKKWTVHSIEITLAVIEQSFSVTIGIFEYLGCTSKRLEKIFKEASVQHSVDHRYSLRKDDRATSMLNTQKGDLSGVEGLKRAWYMQWS